MKALIAPARVYALIVALAFALIISCLPQRPASVVNAQTVEPDLLREISIDDGDAECTVGPAEPQKGKPGFGWVNRLTPISYPATLTAITIGFNRGGPVGREVKPDALYRIIVLLDPENDGPASNQQPVASFLGRVRGTDAIMTFNLVTPITIQSGSFVIGAIDEFGIADLPTLFDVPGKSVPPGSASYITFDGGNSWSLLEKFLVPTASCSAGSWIIRATVETNPVAPLSVTTIKDPLAVEPWDVSVSPLGTNRTFVTNYVSDNLTIISTGANAVVQNLPLGDGPGGTPDGPFGVISSSGRAFVTLFGSNTIPTKEFPIDYSTVGPGRVVVITQQQNGSFAQGVTINVGKGPMFPALVGSKLYVPCSGDNRVDVINTTTNLKVGEIPVGQRPSSCTASLDRSKLYVTNFGDGTISVIETKTDTRIKTIEAPLVAEPLPLGASLPVLPPRAANPWRGAVSFVNGNLYVTYWGVVGDRSPNGTIAEFDTCKDTFVRAVIDDQTRGTFAGTAGASGIPAPTSPLTRDAATGLTPGAGGGGGGPFGITACSPTFDVLIFTNDARGVVGVLDTRIDQVVSGSPISVASCPKPRGVSCGEDPRLLPPNNVPSRLVYVACGQPDNSVLFFQVPRLPENIPNIPVFESVKVGDKVDIEGHGFSPSVHIEVSEPGTSNCLTFEKKLKFKKNGARLLQKGRLSNGQKLSDVPGVIRVVNPDGSTRIILNNAQATQP